MKKKVLISLLMTQPVAFSALADIDTGLAPDVKDITSNESGWDQTGLNSKIEGEAVVASAYATFTKSVTLVPGKYTFEIVNGDNVNLTITDDDKKVYDPKQNVVLEKETKLTITIKAESTNFDTFRLNGINIDVVFDNTEVVTKFSNRLEELNKSILSVTDENASKISGDRKNLTEKYDDINTILTTELSNISYEKYSEYKLYDYPGYLTENPNPTDLITKMINEFADAVGTYNAKVPDEIERQSNYTTNKDKYDSIQVAIGTETDAIDAGTLWGDYNALKALVDACTYEYAKGKAQLEVLSAAITAYEQEIDGIFTETIDGNKVVKDKDVISDDVQVFLDKASEIATQIAQNKTAFENAKADVEAYNAIVQAAKALDEAYPKAVETINTAKGIEGYETVFDDKKADYKTKITTIYNEAKASITVKYGEGVVVEEQYEGCREKLDQGTIAKEARTEIETIAEGFKLDVDANNQAKTKADTDVATIVAKFTEKLQWLGYTKDDHPIFPDEVNTVRQGYIDGFNSGLDSIKETIDGEYAKLDLTEADYSAELGKLESLITALEELAKDSEPFIEYQSKLNEAVEAIKKYDDDFKKDAEGEPTFSVTGHFQSTIDAIQEKLDNTTPMEGLDTTEMDNAITNLKNGAKTLHDDVLDIFTFVNELNKAVVDLRSAVEGKADVSYKKTTREYDNEWYLSNKVEMQTKTVTEWENESTKQYEDYKALNGLTAAALQNEINDLKAQAAESSKLIGQVTTDQELLLEAMTTGNLKVATDAIEGIGAKIEKYLTEKEIDTLPGYDPDMFFKGVNDKVDGIKTDITSAAGDKEKLAAVDEAIKTLIGDIEDLDSTADKLIANKTDYDYLLQKLNEAEAFVGIYDEATEAWNDSSVIDFNNETSTLGAHDYYDAKLQALLKNETEDDAIDEIRTDLEAALAKGASETENVTAKKEDLSGRIDTIKNAATDLKTAIEANKNAYVKQFNEGVDVLNLLNSVYTMLENRDQSLDIITENKAKLDEIKTALNEIDSDVLDAYEKGESVAQDEALMTRYQEQEALIKAIRDVVSSDYDQAVFDQNEKLLDTWGWNTYLAGLWAEYDKSVEAHNFYRDKLENDGYRNAIAEVVESSKDIYNYYTPIRKLESDVLKYMNEECNAAEPAALMSKEKIDEFIKTGDDEILVPMHGKVDKMEAAAEGAAQAYYAAQYEKAENRITKAIKAMGDANIDPKIQGETIKTAQDLLDAAADAYNKESDELLAHRMDNIADLLKDSYETDILTQVAAKTQWDKDYAADKATLDDLVEKLKGYESDKELEQATTNLNNKVGEAETLNNKAIASTNLLGELKADNEELDQIVADAQAIVDASKARHEANKANQELYAAYTAQVEDLEARYAQLEAYVQTLAANVEYGRARTAIDTFNRQVEELKANLVIHQGVINTLYDRADSELFYAALSEAQAEVKWLNKKYDVVRVAFNDLKVKVEFDTEEGRREMDWYNMRMQAVIERINDITEALPKLLTFDETLALQAKMTDLENELCELEVEIKAKADQPDPIEPVTTELNGKYTEVSDVITNGQAYLEAVEFEEIKAAYDGQYDKLKERLDAIHNVWYPTPNSNILAQQDNLMAAMDAILAEAKALDAQIKADEADAVAKAEMMAANEAAYKALSDELDVLTTAYNDAETRIKGYTYGTYDLYQGTFVYIQTLLEATRTDLETRYEACELNAESALINKDTIVEYLNNITIYTTNLELTGWINAAKSAVSTAQTTLPTNIVSDVRAKIVAELAKLATDANALSDEWLGENGEIQLSVADATLDEAKGIIDAVAEQNALAEENTFVIGDIDSDGDVDAVDIQRIINMVGNDTAYEDTEAIVREAADVNGDRKFDTADIVGVINLYLNGGEEAYKVRTAMFAPAVQGDNHVGLQLVSEENGISRYAVEITNAATFVAGQMDILVPAGMEVVGISTADRADAQDLVRFDNSNGMRLILASMDNAEIEGNQGAVVYIDVTGRGRLDIDNVIFADARGVGYTLSKDLTGINSPLIDTLRNAKEAIYNVAGQAMDSLRRGFNIVRKSDGTTSKEYRK